MSPNFNSIEFTATNGLSENINSAYSNSNVPPLADIKIPAASGVVLRNVCLGVVIAILITIGIVDISNVMDDVKKERYGHCTSCTWCV